MGSRQTGTEFLELLLIPIVIILILILPIIMMNSIKIFGG